MCESSVCIDIDIPIVRSSFSFLESSAVGISISGLVAETRAILHRAHIGLPLTLYTVLRPMYFPDMLSSTWNSLVIFKFAPTRWDHVLVHMCCSPMTS